MRRTVVGIFVVVMTVVIPPAKAQFGNTGWGSDYVEVRESDGEAVLTLLFGGTGNVKYRTSDGDAQAPGDYTAVSGEVVFTSAGSRTIRIPILDDDLAEDSSEFFTVFAVEDPNPDPWPHAGAYATVRIIDDDETGTRADSAPGGDSAAGGVSSASGPTTSNDGATERQPSTTARPSAPTPSDAADPVPPTTMGSPSSDLEGELASGGLRPGAGFELTNDGSAEPVPARESGGGGLPLWLATGSGTATLAVGVLAMVQRRRRWSPTQP